MATTRSSDTGAAHELEGLHTGTTEHEIRIENMTEPAKEETPAAVLQNASHEGIENQHEPPALDHSVSWSDINASTPSIDNEASMNDDDADSAMGESIATSTTSLRSSIYEHVEENGRTYHRYKQGKYQLPNDEQEQKRLDLQHALFGLTIHGRQWLAPIGDNPQNVLDFATGTGIWAIEFAQKFPSAHVIGTDLSAIQPLFVPPNCTFEIDDAEDEWVFSTKFDFIHGRGLLSCFADPRSVFEQAFRSLAPGGILELQDGVLPFKFVGPDRTDTDIDRWTKLVCEAGAKIGRPWTNVQYYAQWMRELGFEEVVEKDFYWPTNSWPKGNHLKKLSVYFPAEFLPNIEDVSMKLFTNYLGWTPEQVTTFLASVKKDFKDKSIHAYMPVKVVYGRKPYGEKKRPESSAEATETSTGVQNEI